MRGISYEKASGTWVFGSPSGATFPVSSKAIDGQALNAGDSDMLDGIMFTMRSEPTEHNTNKLDGIMFTMRSEPAEHSTDKLDGIMFTMRSEPTEHNCPAENQLP